jgi:YidC/Oxa1 family membrane protein insertase
MNTFLQALAWPFKKMWSLVEVVWEAIVYKPLLNLLILIVFIVPGHHLWIAVLVLTLIIKFLMAPFSYKGLVSQVKNKKLQPVIEKIKQEHPDNKQLQAQKQLEIYQKIKVNPFSGCLPTLVNLAVILGLFRLFRADNIFDGSLNYSFVKVPEVVNKTFLGIGDITAAHGFSEITTTIVVMAVIAGLSQFIQVKLSPAFKNKKEGIGESGEGNPVMMAQGQMKFMMTYGLPLFVVWLGLTLPPALTFYWVINNLFTIGQEFVVRKKLVAVEQEIDRELKELIV